MLGEKAALLRQRCESLQTLQHGYVNAQHLEQRGAELQAAAETLSRAKSMLNAWQPSPPIKLPKATPNRERLKEVATLVSSSPEAAMSKIDEAASALRDFVGSISSKVASAWTAYAGSLVPAESEEAIAAITDDPDQALAVTRIRRLAIELNRLRTQQILSVEEVGLFESSARELKEMLSAIDVDAVPSQVRAFIVAARSGGANLSMLDGEILEWLKSKELSDDYQVTRRGY
jgi:hypothetical protein